MSRWVVGIGLLCVAGSVCLANGTRELHLAARAGDLAQVRRLVESGLPVDAANAWGTTALAFAAGQNHAEVVRYLLDRGADPSTRETFFGVSVLDAALDKGAPDYRVAKMLLAAGAKDRATALAHALETGDVALARAATESGPLLESEAVDFRAQFPALSSELRAILDSAKTEPDPPPPVYSAKQLAGFAGRFEGGDQLSASVEVGDGRLVLDYAGSRTPLTAVAERLFRNVEGGVTVRYFGRAATIEGLSLERAGQEPVRMRLGDSPTVGASVAPPACGSSG